MFIYQGIDLVDLAKFSDIFFRHQRFEEEIFTRKERDYCRSFAHPNTHFAGRFAAKEACLKALGRGLCGLGVDHILQEVEIIGQESGKPVLAFSGRMAELAEMRRIRQQSVSISHTASYCVASVILTGEEILA